MATDDKARLDWLQDRIVDTIYLDDGKIIDVRGNNLRKAIDKAMKRWPESLEDEEGEQKLVECDIKVEVAQIGTVAIETRDGFPHSYALRANGEGWVYRGGSGPKRLWCPVDAADVPQRYKDAIAGWMADQPSSTRQLGANTKQGTCTWAT